MTKTLIDLDDELLERATRLSGLRTKKSVVTTALEAYVRRLELEAYTEFVAGGALADLSHPAVIKGAQR